MKSDYPTLSAAIRARAWVRLFRKKKGREPTVEERVSWIVKNHTAKIDVAYVNKQCENMDKTEGSLSDWARIIEKQGKRT